MLVGKTINKACRINDWNEYLTSFMYTPSKLNQGKPKCSLWLFNLFLAYSRSKCRRMLSSGHRWVPCARSPVHCLKFINSAPPNALLCTRSIVRKLKLVYSGGNFIVECCWSSQVRVTGTQYKPFCNLGTHFIEISHFFRYNKVVYSRIKKKIIYGLHKLQIA